MSPYERVKSHRKDGKGQVVVKIFLQDTTLVPGYPVSGNRKEEIAIADATVGEIYEIIDRALSTGEESK
jgi:hypothetical protein